MKETGSGTRLDPSGQRVADLRAGDYFRRTPLQSKMAGLSPAIRLVVESPRYFRREIGA